MSPSTGISWSAVQAGWVLSTSERSACMHQLLPFFPLVHVQPLHVCCWAAPALFLRSVGSEKLLRQKAQRDSFYK